MSGTWRYSLDLDDHEPVAPALEAPQPEEVEATVHVVVRDLAVDEQELARRRVVRDEDRPTVSSSPWLTVRIAFMSLRMLARWRTRCASRASTVTWP